MLRTRTHSNALERTLEDKLRVSVRARFVFMVMMVTLCTLRVQGADSITVNVAGKIATATISLADPSPVFDATYSQNRGNVLITGRVSDKLAVIKVNVTYKVVDNTNWELITPKGGSEILSINLGEALNGIMPSSWSLKAIKDTTYTGGGSNKPLNEKKGTVIYGAIPVGVGFTLNPLMIRVDRDYDNKIDDKVDLTEAPYPNGLIVDVNNLETKGSTVPQNSDAMVTDNELNKYVGHYDKDRRVERLKVNLPPGPVGEVKFQLRNPDKPVKNGKFPEDYQKGNGSAGNERIQIFSNDLKREAVLPKSKMEYSFTAKEKTDAADPQNSGLDFWIEGTEPGEVIIDLEYSPPGANKPVVRRVRIEVNVDNPPKDPNKLKSSGGDEARNRVRAIKKYPRVTGISAEFKNSIEPLLTWHKMPRSPASAAMWVGIQVADGSRTWAQAGLYAQIGAKTPKIQGAKPYAEIAIDYAKYISTDPPQKRYYHTFGGLANQPSIGERDWVNMPFLIMYQKGDSLGHDSIIVRYRQLSSMGNPQGIVEFEVNESVAGGATLSDKKFDTIQASFEATQSVTRVPGLPDRKAKIENIKICKAATATKKVVGGQIEPSDAFAPIELAESDLEIITVNNLGKEIKQKDLEFSHYRIKLDINKINDYTKTTDILLWDKYHWMTPDANPLIRKSPYLTD